MAKVLIIEDDHDIRTAYVYALTHAGYEVEEAVDGKQAIAVVERSRPAVILLDMLMPGISGLDFLRQTQIAKRYPDIAIIGFSNIDTPRVVEQAKELGVARYVLKVEVTPKAMVELIQEFIPNPPKS